MYISRAPGWLAPSATPCGPTTRPSPCGACGRGPRALGPPGSRRGPWHGGPPTSSTNFMVALKLWREFSASTVSQLEGAGCRGMIP